jgi:hypothetical protein
MNAIPLWQALDAGVLFGINLDQAGGAPGGYLRSYAPRVHRIVCAYR